MLVFGLNKICIPSRFRRRQVFDLFQIFVHFVCALFARVCVCVQWLPFLIKLKQTFRSSSFLTEGVALTKPRAQLAKPVCFLLEQILFDPLLKGF